MDDPQKQNGALASAFASLRRGLLASIRRQVRDQQAAEDILQDVFLKAVKAMRDGRAPGNLAAWLHAAVRTTVIDAYRAGRLDAQPLEDEPAAPEAESLERFQALATCLEPMAATLPPLYRDALMAADFKGVPLAALADEVTVSAIKSRVSRARTMLRERLLQCCEVDRTGASVEDFRPRSTSNCGTGCSS
jgi:RNA polymerase sigma-70 factor (ECF subfamily)